MAKKWTVIEAARATGLSESTIASTINARGETTKGGITLDQIIYVINSKRRNTNQCNSSRVSELKAILRTAGYMN